MRGQRQEWVAACARWERESLVQDRKVEALQAEVNRLIQDNAKLIRVADQERKEKLELLQREQDWTNHRNLEGAETHKYESLNRVLTIENEALRQEVERSKLEKTALVKEKQNAVNKLVVAESKLEALQMEDQYLKASFAEVAAENERLREENAGLGRRVQESAGGYVKTILKDSNQTKELLLNEFQKKINSKEMVNRQEMEKYEQKVAQLNRKVAHLEAQLLSKC